MQILTIHFFCTSEGIQTIFWSIFEEITLKEGKTHFITSCIEDAPTLQMLKRLERLGCLVKVAPVDAKGQIDVEQLKELITARTALITITCANGLTGVIQPIHEIAEIAKEKNVPLHLEGSYLVGKTYFSFRNIQADYLTFSTALFAKKKITPPISKGNLAALIETCRLANFALDTFGLETPRLRDLLEKKIPGGQILFKDSPRLPNTSVIALPRIHADALQYYLERKGLFVNRGGGGSQHLHSLLKASGFDGTNALSFSLTRNTTEEEILQAVNLIQEKVTFLQKLTEDLF